MVQPLPQESDGMRYTVCDPSEIPELTRMLALAFARNDPPAVAVRLTPAEFEAFVALIVAPATTLSLTVVARDLESGVLAGALLSEDAAMPAPDGMDALSAKFDPIFDLFGRLEGDQAQPEETEPGTVLHLFLLGVDGRFTGRGIAQRLVEAALAHGSTMGYRTAVTEATNRTSQHIFGKAGFTTRTQASYADYRRDGIAVFASISEHGGPTAMVRELA